MPLVDLTSRTKNDEVFEVAAVAQNVSYIIKGDSEGKTTYIFFVGDKVPLHVEQDYTYVRRYLNDKLLQAGK